MSDIEADDLHNAVSRLGTTLEYGGSKVFVVAIVLRPEDSHCHGNVLMKGFHSACDRAEHSALMAGLHQQLSDMFRRNAEG